MTADPEALVCSNITRHLREPFFSSVAKHALLRLSVNLLDSRDLIQTGGSAASVQSKQPGKRPAGSDRSLEPWKQPCAWTSHLRSQKTSEARYYLPLGGGLPQIQSPIVVSLDTDLQAAELVSNLFEPRWPPTALGYEVPDDMSIQLQTPPQSPPQQSRMVSHAEIADRSRRAPSVSSRTSRSRNHRGHSHHGGSAYRPQNEFPFFAQTGDLEVVITSEGQEKRYLLHRLILAQCSGFFQAGTSEEWSRSQALQQIQASSSRPDQALARIGEEEAPAASTPNVTTDSLSRLPPGGRRWRYELDWDNTAEDDEPMLVQRAANSGSLFSSDFAPTQPPPRPKPPPAHNGGFFRSMLGAQSTANLAVASPTESSLSIPIIRDYDNLFKIFYNYAPTLHPTDIAAAYSECKSLLFVADMYDALPVVGPRIDHHLLRFSSRLFKQIAKYPPSYLRLGYLARSRIIFSEALVHVVGQWPMASPYLKDTGYPMPESVIELIEDMVHELEETKAKVEAKLFRLTLTTSRGDRVTPSNDYLGWLAMSLFRQWLAESTTPSPAPILKNSSRSTSRQQAAAPANGQPAAPRPDTTPQGTSRPATPTNTGRVYRQIGSTNSQAYLPHEDLKRFLKLHPSDGSGLYSRDNLRRFERKIDEIKNLARDVVKPLTRNCLELDLKAEAGGGLPYLTCTRVEDDDLPWD